MAIYLDENLFGTDDTTVGFPHLLVCMGFVAVVNDGENRSLWGIHLTDQKAAEEEFPLFAGEFLAAVNPKHVKALYGSCNWLVRYGKAEEGLWRAEMMSFAKQLKFNGPARGFDTGIIQPRDGTYVQYDLRATADSCRIFYRQNDRMKFAKPKVSGAKTARRVVIKPATDISQLPEHLRNNPKVIAKAQGNHVEADDFATVGATAVKGKFWGTGKLREVDYSLRLTEKWLGKSSFDFT